MVRSRWAANAVLHAGFVLAGVVTVLIGPMLPFLIARWSMSDERAGLFFSFQFGGNLGGIASLGTLLSRRGYSAVFLVGFTCIAVGVAGLGSGSAVIGSLGTVAFGYGLGLVLTGTNLWVAEDAGPRRASAISVVNVAWGVGAIACPLLVLVAERAHRLSLLLFGIAGLSAMAAVVLATMNVAPRLARSAEGMPPDGKDSVPAKTAFALGALFLLYVGIENSVGGWAAALVKREGALPAASWEFAPMFFWAGLLIGRAAAPIVFSRVAEKTIMISGLLFSGMCIAALTRVTSLRVAAVDLSGAGLGLACLFPLLIAWMVERYGKHARRTGNVPFALASIGGATMPWLVGFVSTHAGSLRAGIAVPAAGCLVMVGLQALLRPPAIARD